MSGDSGIWTYAIAATSCSTRCTGSAAGSSGAHRRTPRRTAPLGERRSAAYPLDTGDAPDFTPAVAAEAIAHPELRIELTGPWPPYPFAAQDDDEN
jgi:hypothetical protein